MRCLKKWEFLKNRGRCARKEGSRPRQIEERGLAAAEDVMVASSSGCSVIRVVSKVVTAIRDPLAVVEVQALRQPPPEPKQLAAASRALTRALVSLSFARVQPSSQGLDRFAWRFLASYSLVVCQSRSPGLLLRHS